MLHPQVQYKCRRDPRYTALFLGKTTESTWEKTRKLCEIPKIRKLAGLSYSN